MEVNTSTTPDTVDMYNYINGFLLNPSAFIIVALVLVAYFIVFVSLGKNNNTQSAVQMPNSATNGVGASSGYSSIVIGLVIGILFILLLVNGLQYFFGINIVASLKNVFLGEPIIGIKVENNTEKDAVIGGGGGSGDNNQGLGVPEIHYTEQVFNIPGNYYGYEDAKSLCTAFGARLANYQEVEKTYNKGGEWCNYGWSDGQMALFPTQQSTFDNLQKIKGHEHDCGRPGVNGGYMANPHLKFGVNCYGYKPKMNDEEEKLMQVNTAYPKTEKDILFEKRVDYWKTKLDDILVSPFNYDSWSKI
jgi:hypothetical protein